MKLNLRQLRRRIERGDWYRQAAAVKPFYIGYPWKSCYRFTLFGRVHAPRFHSMQIYLQRYFMEVYFDRRNLMAVARAYWQRQRRDITFLNTFRRRWENEHLTPLRQHMATLQATNLSQLSDEELAERFQLFSQRYEAFWREAIFLDAFDVGSDHLLNAALRRAGVTLTPAQLHELTSVTRPSWLQREQLGLVRLLRQVKRTPTLRRSVARGVPLAALRVRFPQFTAALAAHAAAFHWIRNDYAVIRKLAPQFFLRRLREWLAHPKQPAAVARDLRALRRIAQRKLRIARASRLPRRLMGTIEFLVGLAECRDERKSHNQMANGILIEFAREFARRSRLPQGTVESLFWWEVRDVPSLIRRRRQLHALARQRLAGVHFYDRHLHGVAGSNGRKLHRYLDHCIGGGELRGTPAYPGVVHGVARIILGQQDFRKLRRGNVLITPNTRPEYVPIMKLAGAIITEEGGLTCHAAIVSRELKVPCVVGVQGALSRIADGDRVEVDATRGMVKILRRR